MNFLILTCSTGGGHNSTAAAISEYLTAQGHGCQEIDCLSFLSPAKAKLISDGHVLLYRKAPKLFGMGYRFEEQHTPKFILSQCEGCAEAFARAVRDANCDALICVHVFASLIATAAIQYGMKQPFYFVATDYTCSPGVSSGEPNAFFIPHPALTEEFIACGVPADKIVPTGIPVRTQFYERGDKIQARRKLDLPETGKLVLLTCGSMGAGPMEDLALLLDLSLRHEDHLAVICGTNVKLVERLHKAPLSSRVHIIGFTHEMNTYMDASDLILTKPGGLTTTEVLAKHLPLVYINAVPGCETRNLDFMVQRGYARTADSVEGLSALVCRLLADDRCLARWQETLARDFSQRGLDLMYDYLKQDLHL